MRLRIYILSYVWFYIPYIPKSFCWYYPSVLAVYHIHKKNDAQAGQASMLVGEPPTFSLEEPPPNSTRSHDIPSGKLT
jgi:hypothetical protein